MTNLTNILKNIKSGWVALTPNNEKLVAKGPSLKQVLEKAKKKGITNPSVLKTSSLDKYFIG
ncbi:MAG: hypothetical protein ACD_19C00114G0004 [uncultured bacterium]|nr:MAG: hypothetical protein ACD_19C00114G0004 [uncultured bacterium]